MGFDFREDFPLIKNAGRDGRSIAYLDNAATTQKPQCVIDAVREYYENLNSNPHRGAYYISEKSTEMYEDVRVKTAKFIGAKSPNEIVFTKGTTESINIIAMSYGMDHIGPGDEILLAVSEHHSNLMPWQRVAKTKGGVIRYMYVDDEGRIPREEIDSKINERTRIVAFAHVSNVLGRINPTKYITDKAHSVGAVVVLDAAQGLPHVPVDVTELDVDFAAFSAHKMLGPAGVGVMYGRGRFLNEMQPLLLGGGMVDEVSEQAAVFSEYPIKFEGGTQNTEGVIGFGRALDYLADVGYDEIRYRESDLVSLALKGFRDNPHITVYGGTEDAEDRTGIITFNVDGAHPHDVATILDSYGVAIRAGHHCAHPLMKYLGVNSTCRMSAYFYNTQEDIERLIEGLSQVRRWLRIES